MYNVRMKLWHLNSARDPNSKFPRKVNYFLQKLANVKYNFPWSKKCQTVFFVHHTKHNNIITKILKETFFILKTKKMLVNIMLEINTNYFGRCPNGGDPLPKLFGPISPSDISIDLEPIYFIKIVIFTQF